MVTRPANIGVPHGAAHLFRIRRRAALVGAGQQ